MRRDEADQSTTRKAGAVEDIAGGPQLLKSNVGLQTPGVPVGPYIGHVQSNTIECGILTLDVAAVAALVVLLPNVLEALKNERTRLHVAHFDLGKPISELCHCLSEEQERLQLVEQKVAEKSCSHKRAAAQFRRARQVLNIAKVEARATTTHGQKPAVKTSLKTCEHIVDSWAENVAIAYAQLESWELKMKIQRERVAKSKAELTASDQLYREKSCILDASLSQLQVLDLALASVGGFTMGVSGRV